MTKKIRALLQVNANFLGGFHLEVVQSVLGGGIQVGFIAARHSRILL